MALDLQTMVLGGAFIAMLCGALLIYAWAQYRDMPAALWWGSSHLLLAACGVLGALSDSTGSRGLLEASLLALVTSAALQWHASRLLTLLKPIPLLVVGGPVTVGLLNLLPAEIMPPLAREIPTTLLNTIYLIATTATLVRPALASPTAFRPLAAFLLVHIGLTLFGLGAGVVTAASGEPLPVAVFGLLRVLGVVCVIGTTIFVVAAVRERSERAQRDAASTDSLTGLANRRSFFERAGRLATLCEAEGIPFGVMLIDLDRFKSINDRFGHAVGDRVLARFGDVARSTLRPRDVVGRLGGEEFAVVLGGTDAETTMAMAERVRTAFAAAATDIDGMAASATLSVGVALSTDGAGIDLLLRDADAALYRAKENGRNRVEYGRGVLPPEPDAIPRVA